MNEKLSSPWTHIVASFFRRNKSSNSSLNVCDQEWSSLYVVRYLNFDSKLSFREPLLSIGKLSVKLFWRQVNVANCSNWDVFYISEKKIYHTVDAWTDKNREVSIAKLVDTLAFTLFLDIPIFHNCFAVNIFFQVFCNFCVENLRNNVSIRFCQDDRLAVFLMSFPMKNLVNKNIILFLERHCTWQSRSQYRA